MANDRITIDVNTRRLTIPPTEQFFGVYQDRNAERRYFECPRYMGDNIDMSQCRAIINYVSAGNNPGRYICNDLALDGEAKITFTWLLSGNVFDTNVDGWVRFAVQFIDASGETVLNTLPASGETKSTVEGKDAVEEEYADIILDLMAQVNSLTERITEKTITLTLSTDGWIQSSDATYYTQEVSIEGSTVNTRVNLDPTAEQLLQILQEEVSLFVVNDNGTILVYSVNNVPSTDMAIKAILKEVL